jgi:hypothetical protein
MQMTVLRETSLLALVLLIGLKRPLLLFMALGIVRPSILEDNQKRVRDNLV